MPKLHMKDLTLWHSNGDDLPPAPAAAMPKPEKIIDLGAALQRAYSKEKRRIA